MSKIRVENLFKVFGKNPKRTLPMLEEGKSKDEILDETGCTVAINNASFEINEKEMFVIMGLSGSGKSTVLRCLNRLIEPTEGAVYIDDQNILDMDEEELLDIRRTKMSMVFQNFGLFPHRTVVNNVEYGLEIGGMPKEERHPKALKALELVGLKGYEDKKPSELSGGMQQRVGLARALANDPEVLLMDEAFSALDPLIRADMQDELLELQADMHKTVVFITHDLDEALKIGDRIAIMKDGKVVQVGTPEQILTEPADDYVRAFVQNVDRTKVITAQTIMRKAPTVNLEKDGPRVAARKMEKVGVSTIYVTDGERRLQGIAKIDDVVELQKDDQRSLEPVLIKDVETTHPDTPIKLLLNLAITAPYPIAVVDDDGKIKGIVDRASIMAELSDEIEPRSPQPKSATS
jgi:glycine betaine/proline transport system ATP-binding protein